VIIITEQETIHLGVIIPVRLHSLIRRVSKARGEGISSFARRAILKELAALSFLSDKEKKALGMAVEVP
jgi:hypothetical protein